MSAPDASSKDAGNCQLEATTSSDQSPRGEVSRCRATDLERGSSTEWSALDEMGYQVHSVCWGATEMCWQCPISSRHEIVADEPFPQIRLGMRNSMCKFEM